MLPCQLGTNRTVRTRTVPCDSTLKLFEKDITFRLSRYVDSIDLCYSHSQHHEHQQQQQLL